MKCRLLYNIIPTQPARSKRHGGGRYGEVVFKYIITHGYDVICVYDSTKWLNPEIEQLIKDNHIKIYDVNKTAISEIVNIESITTYYTPMVNSNTIGDWNCKIVGTIHGLRSLETPADKMYFKYKGWKNLAMYLGYNYLGSFFRKKRSAFLSNLLSKDNFYPVTVSRHSSYSIKTFFPITQKKNEIPIFYSPSTNTGREICNRKYNEKYIFIVSAFVPFKNGLRAIMALDRLFEYGCLEGYKVKVTGLASPEAYRYKLKNAGKFEFLGFVTDEDLEQLFHDAYCLVYPSLNEGFGYPPIEAMHYGVPVLASPFTSITEVCGDAAVYFNPFSVEEIMGRILYMSDKEVHEKYKTKSLKQYEIIHQKQEEDLKGLVEYIYNL